MTRGRAAATLASGALGLLLVAVGYGVVAATEGAYLLVVAPIAGVAIGGCVWLSLRRVCTTPEQGARRVAMAGIVALFGVAVLGISFGGALLAVPAAALALATLITPAPSAAG